MPRHLNSIRIPVCRRAKWIRLSSLVLPSVIRPSWPSQACPGIMKENSRQKRELYGQNIKSIISSRWEMAKKKCDFTIFNHGTTPFYRGRVCIPNFNALSWLVHDPHREIRVDSVLRSVISTHVNHLLIVRLFSSRFYAIVAHRAAPKTKADAH